MAKVDRPTSVNNAIRSASSPRWGPPLPELPTTRAWTAWPAALPHVTTPESVRYCQVLLVAGRLPARGVA